MYILSDIDPKCMVGFTRMPCGLVMWYGSPPAWVQEWIDKQPKRRFTLEPTTLDPGRSDSPAAEVA